MPMMMSSETRPPASHDGFGLHAELAAGLDLRTQHVASGDLRDAVIFLDVIGLCAFARAGATQQNQTHCLISL